MAGAVIAKAGADRTTPLATATLVLAANAPDVDVLSFVRGSYYALSFRRGITHGWPALLLWPFVVTAVILGWDRLVRRRRDPDTRPVSRQWTLALSAIGVVTHPTLDWMNTYGMRWWLPFNGRWSYRDALFIIDPWIWLVLGGAVFLSARPGPRARAAWTGLALLTSVLVLVGMGFAAWSWLAGMATVVWLYRAGRPSTAGGRRRLAAGALVIVTLYIATLVTLDGLAGRDVRSAAEASGLGPRDIMVAPAPGRILVSSVEVRTDRGYVPGEHRWIGAPRVELRPAEIVPLVTGPPGLAPHDLDEIIERARAVPQARDYLVWARYPYAAVRRDGDAWLVRFADARYDDEPGAAGLAGVEVRVARR